MAGPAHARPRHRARSAAVGRRGDHATAGSARPGREGSAGQGPRPSAEGWPARGRDRPAAVRVYGRAAAGRSGRPGPRRQLVGRVHRERCLADPDHPPIAWMRTTPPELAAPAALATSCSSSDSRPVNDATSRGSVRVATGRPPTDPLCHGDPPAVTVPLAAASNPALAEPVRFSASASRRAVSLRAVRLMPRSRSLTDCGLSLAASASCSCVSPACVRSCLCKLAKEAGGCSVLATAPFPSLKAAGLSRPAACRDPRARWPKGGGSAAPRFS